MQAPDGTLAVTPNGQLMNAHPGDTRSEAVSVDIAGNARPITTGAAVAYSFPCAERELRAARWQFRDRGDMVRMLADTLNVPIHNGGLRGTIRPARQACASRRMREPNHPHRRPHPRPDHNKARRPAVLSAVTARRDPEYRIPYRRRHIDHIEPSLHLVVGSVGLTGWAFHPCLHTSRL